MRTIRLKETPPTRHREHSPPQKYLDRSDGSLGIGPFVQRGTIDGYLDTGNERPHASKNLVMLGGSFVESMFADEQDRFPSQVERSLPDDWKVLNGGYSGMTTLHMVSLLAAKIPMSMIPGSKLILFIGQSDTTAMASEGTYWSDINSVTPIRPHSGTPFSPWEPKDAVARTIDALLALADAFGFEYGVVASPFRDGDFSTDQVLRKLHRGKRDLYERVVDRRRFIQNAARAAAERRNVPFFDGQSVIETQHMYDSMHLNITGQHVFAEAITEWVADWAIPGDHQVKLRRIVGEETAEEGHLSIREQEEITDMGYDYCESCQTTFMPVPGYENYGHQCNDDGLKDKYFMGTFSD